MRRNLDNRLVKLETITQPADPPTIQVIWPDGPGPIQAAPHGQWKGLKRVKVKYTRQQWESV